MTDEERDTKEARLLLEQKRKRQEVALHKDDARKLGDLLSSLGSVFQKSPESFLCGNQSASYDVVDAAKVPRFNESDLRGALNFDHLVETANNLRKSMSELLRTENTLQSFR